MALVIIFVTTEAALIVFSLMQVLQGPLRSAECQNRVESSFEQRQSQFRRTAAKIQERRKVLLHLHQEQQLHQPKSEGNSRRRQEIRTHMQKINIAIVALHKSMLLRESVTSLHILMIDNIISLALLR